MTMMLTGLPATARGLVQQTTNTPHETVIDGRWEVKTNTDQKVAIVFEFKKANGVVTGTMIQGGKTTEIKNGTLEGTKLEFETTIDGITPNPSRTYG